MVSVRGAVIGQPLVAVGRHIYAEPGVVDIREREAGEDRDGDDARAALHLVGQIVESTHRTAGGELTGDVASIEIDTTEEAVRAFDAQAIDYVRKPVQPERLRKTVARVQQALAAQQQPATPRPPADVLEQTLAEWRRLIGAAGAPATTSAALAPPLANERP